MRKNYLISAFEQTLEERFPALVECAVKKSEEDTSILAKNVTVLVVQLTEDVDLSEDSIGVCCHCELL